MDESIFSEFPKEFIGPFLAFCETPAPDPVFVSELQQQLLERQRCLKVPAQPARPLKSSKPFSAWFLLHKWQFAIIVLVVALVTALLAIGPQRVLAQIQLWFGYLPRVGFINPDQTRVLAAPLEARQDETTLLVQQVIASTEKTMVVATLTSLPDKITLDTQWASRVTLILPDGQRLGCQRSSQRNQPGQLWAEIEFPPLPEGIVQVTLEMPKLPIVTNTTQEFWSVILSLQEVGQASLNAGPSSAQEATQGSAMSDNLAVAPYTPKNAEITNQGVTVHLLQVGQSAQEIGLLLQVDWSDPTWDYLGSSAELHDNLGHGYQQLEPPPGNESGYNGIPQGKTTAQEILRFAPLDPGVQQATLTLDTIDFQIHPLAQFQFDPGYFPHLGQTWFYLNDPAKRLEMAGFQVQVLQASLISAPANVQVTVVNPPEATLLPQPTPLPGFACRLEFIVQVTPQINAQLVIGPPIIFGENRGPAGMFSEGNLNQATVFLDLTEIPTTPLTIQFDDSSLLLQGGWQIRWDVQPASNK